MPISGIGFLPQGLGVRRWFLVLSQSRLCPVFSALGKYIYIYTTHMGISPLYGVYVPFSYKLYFGYIC